MKRNLILGLALLVSGVFIKAYADSPLTSTSISAAFPELFAVIEASHANGWLTESLMEYIASDDYRVDARIAVINELGWDVDGKNNFGLMVNYFIQNGYFSDEEDLFMNASGYQLINLAYMLALDNYHDVDLSLEIAALAINKAPTSYTVNMIFALIAAQQAVIAQEFCLAYTFIDTVRKDDTLNFDMDLDAQVQIFLYMDSYYDFCQ